MSATRQFILSARLSTCASEHQACRDDAKCRTSNPGMRSSGAAKTGYFPRSKGHKPKRC